MNDQSDIQVNLSAHQHIHCIDNLRELYRNTVGCELPPRSGARITCSLEFLIAHHEKIVAFAQAISNLPSPKSDG